MTRLLITAGDRFTLGATTFVVSASSGENCLAYPDGQPDLSQAFQVADLASRLGSNNFAFDRTGTDTPALVGRKSLNSLHPGIRQIVLRRLAYVEGYIKLLGATEFLKSKASRKATASEQREAASATTGGIRFVRTRPSAEAAAVFLQPQIDRLGTFVLTDDHKILLDEDDGSSKKRRPRHGSPMKIVNGEVQVTHIDPPRGGSLLDWLARYEKANGHWEGLVPLYDKCGNYGAKLSYEVQAIITAALPTYLTKEQISPARFRENVNSAIKSANADRKRDGLPVLELVGNGAIKKVISQLDPFYADYCRLDEGSVRAKWSWAQDTIQYQVAGQRIEIDAYQTDLMTLLIMSGAWEGLTPKERKEVKRDRLWLTIAIDVATRVILALRLSPNPDVPNGISVLEMVESDKSAYSQAAGCETIWSQRTGLWTVVADGGYISDEMRTAITEARATFENPIAKAAYLRPYVERVFRTVATRLMSRLRGKTFSNILERGEYDSEGNACLTTDDLCWILVTWVVDIYHQTPHESLGGMTPAQAWERSEEMFGIRPWRDAHGRRTAFGVHLQREVTTNGVEVLGNFYRDDTPEGLRTLRKLRNGATATVMVDVANLGAISIVIDTVSYTLPSRDRKMEGVRAQDWIETTTLMRQQYASGAEIPREIAYRALGRIIDRNNAAGMRADLASQTFTKESLDYFEAGLFKAIKYAAPSPDELSRPLGEPIMPVTFPAPDSPRPETSASEETAPQHPAVEMPKKKKREWKTE